MSRGADFKQANCWPHVLQVGESWEGIIRDYRHEERIKWQCGHSHYSQQAARSCARDRFQVLLRASIPEHTEEDA